MLEKANVLFGSSWTPDGEKVVFNVRSQKGSKTYVVASDGSNLRMVSEGGGKYKFDHSLDISPDGSSIVYGTTRHSEVRDHALGSYIHPLFEIETSRLDGSDRRRLTDNEDLDTSPAWSPDGTRIAFLKVRPFSEHRGIYTMAADGSDVRQLVHFRQHSSDSDVQELAYRSTRLAWSPDGELLAYLIEETASVRGEDGQYEGTAYRHVLYVVRSDGSETTRVASVDNAPSVNYMRPPAWSPTGQLLAFAINGGEGRAIYTVRPDGTDLRQVVVGLGASQVSWSPDGSEIRFLFDGTAYVADSDGSGLRRLSVPFIGNGALWSPDGMRIVASDGEGVNFTISPDGSDLRILTRRDGDDYVAGIETPSETRVDVRPCSTDIVVPEPEANPGLVKDCETLLGLRDALAGNADLNWNKQTPITEWEGVRVLGVPLRIRDLFPWGRDLTGTIPPELVKLSELRILNLSRNKLTGGIPEELGGLPGLLNLDLQSNYLTGNIPPELGRLTSLVYLSLRDNSLSGRIPSELGTLENLQHLDLSLNQLHGGVTGELGTLAHLQHLNLGGNQLGGHIPLELGALERLNYLNLSLNQLTGNIPPELAGLNVLLNIDLSRNDLNGTIPPELGDLWELEGLDFSYNDLTGSLPPELMGMERLEQVDLSGNALSGCVPTELADIWVDRSVGLDRCKQTSVTRP